MNNAWLLEIFMEAGFEPAQAEVAAEATWLRLLRRETSSIVDRRPQRLTRLLVTDPMVSLNRIIGRGDEGLPYVDPESAQLSSFALANTFNEAGLDPVVAQAYANVVVEMVDPRRFYQPVWDALGLGGDFDLETLRLADWSALRAGHPQLEGLPQDSHSDTRSAVQAAPARAAGVARPRPAASRAQPDPEPTRVDAVTPGGTQVDARSAPARRRPRPQRRR